ncbi:FkbM family methyltransferase [Geomonas oryzae]|uniref:FkbM family methyltransferase n=1 Tax=Geomonas oryzae TaxID=2364273 RepID=UPI0013A5C2F3|nr:FkbM family methyltransferase [Geomonas oryzae]
MIQRKYLHYLASRISGPGQRPRCATVFGAPFYCDDPLGVASLQRVYCDSHHLKDYLPNRPVVVDVGANIGQFAFFARQYLEAARVISVEPLPESHQMLLRNTPVPGDSLCCAVTDREGSVTIHVAQETTQLSSYVQQPDCVYRACHTVAARTLDGIAAELGVGEVDLLKIDTEGSEFDVLRSAPELLRRSKFVLVEMSVFRNCSGDLFQVGAFLKERGFELVALSPCRQRRPRDLDGLFRRL